MKVMKSNTFGPVTRYSDAHIFVVMDILNRTGVSCRKKLMEETELGEGSVRGLLKVLKDWKWVEIKQTGVSLTDTGRSNFNDFGIKLVEIKSGTYGIGCNQQGVIISGLAHKVTNGMAQRDMAVRYGAEGASVFVMREGMIIFPDSWDVDTNDPRTASDIRATGIQNGDILMIVDSDTKEHARLIAASVGLAMR